MQVEDKIQFLKVLNGMAAMKKATLIPEVLDLWWLCMADWSIEDFKAAAVQVLKRSDFMPGPKDFEDLRKAGKDTPGEAFATALDWVRSGAYKSTPQSARAKSIDRAVQLIGGYKVIAMCEEDKLHFLERRFCEHYETMTDSDSVRLALPKIASNRLLLQ